MGEDWVTTKREQIESYLMDETYLAVRPQPSSRKNKGIVQIHSTIVPVTLSSTALSLSSFTLMAPS